MGQQYWYLFQPSVWAILLLAWWHHSDITPFHRQFLPDVVCHCSHDRNVKNVAGMYPTNENIRKRWKRTLFFTKVMDVSFLNNLLGHGIWHFLRLLFRQIEENVFFLLTQLVSSHYSCPNDVNIERTKHQERTFHFLKSSIPPTSNHVFN